MHYTRHLVIQAASGEAHGQVLTLGGRLIRRDKPVVHTHEVILVERSGALESHRGLESLADMLLDGSLQDLDLGGAKRIFPQPVSFGIQSDLTSVVTMVYWYV